MLYLGTSPSEPEVVALLDERHIGLMCQPGSNHPRPGWIWAADNGCFSPKGWDAQRWADWLWQLPSRSGCLFASVPDVVGDAAATLERFRDFRSIIVEANYPVAFVGQDGLEIDRVPWNQLDCLFIGGTDEWKGSEDAIEAAKEAHRREKWVHVGRVNGDKRYQAWAPFADSCDGTFLAFGPEKNLTRLRKWHDRRHREPTMWDVVI